MSSGQILLLGAVAGFTIFLGLPLARIKNPSVGLKAFLTALATGVLVFLLVDVLEHGIAPVEHAAEDHVWSSLAGYGALLLGGFGVGFMGLIAYERFMVGFRRRTLLGPGAASAQEFERTFPFRLTAGGWLALLIATGIGLHNFAEGLAIGQAAATGALSLAVLLVIGFGLHNATEGFGIVGPLAGEDEPPSWRLLGLLGLIGGGPTFVGTVVGQAVTSDEMSVAFLSLAAGSILYVVIQLVGVALRAGHKEMLYWGVFLGLIAGFATDFVVTAAGV